MTLRDRARGISLGLFAGDLGALRSEAAEAAVWGCNLLHFDVMDGVFVPQFTGGPGFLKGLGDAVLDAHLMVQRPADHVADYVKAGAGVITIHAEADAPGAALTEAQRTAEAAGQDLIAGIAVMPGTALDDLGALIKQAPDVVLVLALDPRDGAPPDIAAACTRVHQVRDLLPDALIAFDGGVTQDTMPQIMTCAPDMVVSGSAVMKASDRQAAYNAMSALMA